MATNANKQTELKRKAAARKGQATRHRNQAARARTTESTARNRLRAEGSTLAVVSLEARRALDASLGAAVRARDGIVGAVRPLTDRGTRGTASSVRRRIAEEFDDSERRGAKVRSGFERDARRYRRRVETELNRRRRDLESRTRRLRGALERPVKRARGARASV